MSPAHGLHRIPQFVDRVCFQWVCRTKVEDDQLWTERFIRLCIVHAGDRGVDAGDTLRLQTIIGQHFRIRVLASRTRTNHERQRRRFANTTRRRGSCVISRQSKRHNKVEFTSLAQFALRPHASPHQLHKLRGYHSPKPVPPKRRRGGAIALPEGLEDGGQLVRRNPDPRVAHDAVNHASLARRGFQD